MDLQSTSPGASTGMQGLAPYDFLGGMDGCRKLATAFYARVERDPVLRPLFPSFHCAIRSLTAFLAQFLGGPCEYADGRWSLSLREAHLRFKIGQRERDAWLQNMIQALDDVQIEEPARSALHRFFEQSSTFLINQPGATTDDPSLSGECATTEPPESSANHIHQDIAQRWEALRTLEETVIAVRRGHAEHALALAESSLMQTYFFRDRAALLSLLAVMSGSSHPAMLDYVRGKLLGEPEIVRERYTSGRTLLHDAAGTGSLTIVELLLRFGADPNAINRAGHTPLYFVGNGCTAESGGEIVRLLVRGGANLDASDGVKQCTALHMAARRGNIRVAEALLDCGADLDARDSLGETPLRRAVNCGKVEMAAFLLSRGADAQSRGSRGLTPWQVARGAAMKQLLQSYRES